MQHDKQSREELLTRAQQEDATPDELLDAEQRKRKRDRAKKRKQRVVEREEKAASVSETEREWWNGNRATLDPEKLAVMTEQDAYIHEILTSLEMVQSLDDELVEIVVELVKENGTAHLGSIVKDVEIPADWEEQQYWQNLDLVKKLEAESEATATYVRFGLFIALPDWRIVEFLTRKAGWKWDDAAKLVGWYETREGYRHK